MKRMIEKKRRISMRKKKIYLDTSVVSYLRQEDAPNEMRQTQELWEVLKKGKYDVYLSEIMVYELSKCSEPKRSELLGLLSEIEYIDTKVENNAEIIALADEIRKLDILPPKSENDRRHIAAAVYNGCNAILSWNFNHMVNVNTIDGVRMVCLANNLPLIDIYAPYVLLERSVSDG
jgi:predicted nucleic acid-binding protein